MFSRKNKWVKFLNNSVWDYKVPININNWWYFGSLLGLMLVCQIISGFFLSTHYVAHVDYAFDSIVHINRDVNYGALIRGFHINGASMFFFFMYIHIGRGIYYGCYRQAGVWYTGIVLMLLLMATSFLGYVLPWGQMSYWASVVITSLLSTIPYIGPSLVEWIWGGYAVGQATLTRFYSLHFILPFIMVIVVIIHVGLLHETGSSNPLGLYDPSGVGMRSFHPLYSCNDLFFCLVAMGYLIKLSAFHTWAFVPCENWIKADPMTTPKHITPEWYFLWVYTILRSAPTKGGGVALMVLSILVLAILPLVPMTHWQGGTQFSPVGKMLFALWVSNWLIMTWVGSQPATWPFMEETVYSTVIYFAFFPVFLLNLALKASKFQLDRSLYYKLWILILYVSIMITIFYNLPESIKWTIEDFLAN
ncbi:cytochrome b (mitochondrion) [Lingula anatina]|uniref:Cytochrome b n=1 Tax=Lingula anatina TaxID=7574 RepID=A0A2H4H114_LINAN|nr:cytochrome b [Lingula anatina]ARH11228.1 cytochrome b [Lingula anatina]QUJ09532.1 cytochrome b [Lingula anatina]|eukprot:YP_009450465.1 cytochrome b (mitochondrion) [Lingula anatina]